MTDKHFQQNLDIWSHYYPAEAVMLPYVDAEDYKLEEGRLIGPKGVYPTEDPVKWFSSLQMKKQKVLAVYGLGTGELYPSIKEWLNQDKQNRVFFFEEDPNVLVRFFETDQASTLLNDPQVEIHLLQNLTDKDPALDKFFWSAVSQTMNVGIHPAYQAWYPERAKEFEYKVRYALEVKNALIEEYEKLGISFFRNFYFNLLELPYASSGNSLFNKFKGVPAIICGAGPSLNKQIEKLGSLKDKAFIVAGGSSLNALSHAGITPHFSAALDPNAEQAIRLKTHATGDVPFFYRNRLFMEALRLIKGPRLYVNGSGGYDVSDYFDEEFGLGTEFIDEGHNVINFLCEITTRMGCNPIIFVGLDLAYTDDKIYADGVIQDTKLDPKHLPEGAVEHVNSKGQTLLTEWKWLNEAKWIEEFAKEHEGHTFINCTEGGLGIAGIEEAPFDKVIKRVLKTPRNHAEKLTKAIQDAKKTGVTKERVIELMLKMKESLTTCKASLETMYHDAEERISKNPLAPPGARIPVIELELLDEIGYEYVLGIFNQVWAMKQNDALRRLRLDQEKRPPKEIEREKLIIQNERVKFLIDVAELNIRIISLAI